MQMEDNKIGTECGQLKSEGGGIRKMTTFWQLDVASWITEHTRTHTVAHYFLSI